MTFKQYTFIHYNQRSGNITFKFTGGLEFDTLGSHDIASNFTTDNNGSRLYFRFNVCLWADQQRPLSVDLAGKDAIKPGIA